MQRIIHDLRTPELRGGPDLLRRFYAIISARPLQPVWRALHFLSLRGMGCKNIYPTINGEIKFLKNWSALYTSDNQRPLVIDVGANEGDFAASVLGLCTDAEIHCFEPNTPTFGRLKSRFLDNDNVHLSEVALGADTASATLYDLYSGGSGQATFLPESISVDEQSATKLTSRRVEIDTLDDYVEKHQIARIDLLKIDVEGFEKQVLQGAKKVIDRGGVTNIQIEWNVHNAMTGFTIYELTRILPNYEIFRLLPNGFIELVTRNVRYRPEVESFVYSNLVAKRYDE